MDSDAQNDPDRARPPPILITWNETTRHLDGKLHFAAYLT
jgi:hypothetical protein